MRPETLYLGWDVGGWEGTHDGLAALQVSATGCLTLLAEPVQRGLKDVLRADGFGIGSLLGTCGVGVQCDRVVLGIDAPLGWPLEAARFVASCTDPGRLYLPRGGGEIENRYAYRLCDRVVHRRCGGKKPLSAVFDRLGNNATKAMMACQRLAASDGAVLAHQGGEGGKVVVCEVYPALWKQGGRKAGALADRAAEALEAVMMPAPGTDKADAVLCALAAVCYDNQTRGLGLGLPELYTPEDEYGRGDVEADARATVAREGWIYFPKSALN